MNTACCDVQLSSEPLDCCLNPAAQILGVGLASGGVELYSYAVSKSAPKDGSEGEVVSITQFKQDSFPGPGDEEEVISCRAVYFTPCGERIIAGYEDTNITMFDLTKGKIVHTYEEAHGSQVERLICIDDNVFASGDENGEICLWDIRTKAKVYSYKEHRDYISDFTIHVDSNSLCAVSGDGTLSVHDIARRKFKHRSEDDNDDELLSVVSVKGGKKLVCGTQSGVINLYTWGAMNDCSDRFPGHPESVQAIVKFDEDTILTGSSDGVIRILSILPNKLLGVLGEHEDEFPIERLALSADRAVLASASHDEVLKLWDMSMLLDDEDEDEEGEEGEEEEAEAAMAAALAQRARNRASARDDDDHDEDDEDDEDGEDDEGEEGEQDEGPSGSGAEDEEEEEAAAKAGPSGRNKATSAADVKGSEKGGVAVAGAKRKAVGSGGGEDSDGDEEGDSDDDSDDDDGGKKKKKKQEKTKWTKGLEQKKKPSSNFFADLL